MTLGEVIGRICSNMGEDYEIATRMTREIYEIYIENDTVVICYCDGNASDDRF